MNQNIATVPMAYGGTKLEPTGADGSHSRCDGNDSRDGGDEQELTDFDADVEEKQRQRNRPFRQADVAQRPGESEAVQQTERERHDPRPPRGRSRPPLPAVDDLRGDEHDAERDDGLDRRHRARERMPSVAAASVMLCAMRERRDRSHDAFPALDQKQQRQDEEQMIDTEQDVLDAIEEVGSRPPRRGLAGTEP